MLKKDQAPLPRDYTFECTRMLLLLVDIKFQAGRLLSEMDGNAGSCSSQDTKTIISSTIA